MPTPTDLRKTHYDTDAAAERLDCTPDHVGKLCRQGKLERAIQRKVALEPGGPKRVQWYIPRKSITDYRRAQTRRENRIGRSRR